MLPHGRFWTILSGFRLALSRKPDGTITVTHHEMRRSNDGTLARRHVE